MAYLEGKNLVASYGVVPILHECSVEVEKGELAVIVGPNGAGNPAAKYPAIRGQHAEYTASQLQQYANNSRDTDQQQMMRLTAKKLTEEEILQLAKYVSALH